MPISRDADNLECPHGMRRHSIVQVLLADVIHGQLRPGEHLVTQDLAVRFGVSHTPIREALMTLAGMGIIDLLPNRGAVVRQMTTREVREIYRVRRALECVATRAACGQLDPAHLHALAGELRRLLAAKAVRSAERYIEQAREIDSRLHDLIGAASGNGFLAKELDRLKTLFRAFRDAAWEVRGQRQNLRRVREEAQEHLEVVEALLDNNAKEAARAMGRHLRSGCRYWTRVMAEPASSSNGQGNGAKSPPRNYRK